ncbi:MAG: fasciclin domain-containing protein, partial [Bacteroidales bacterium]|nr:fasciclin domain-containing protein [Bacteroidales bacterium]
MKTMKTNLRKIKLFALAMLAVTVFVSCSKDDDDPSTETKNIVQTASGDSQFSILTDALGKANLVSALESTGPFTVFAPTNDAFNALFTQLGVSGLD